VKLAAGSARRYARALLDVAVERGDPAAVRRDLGAIASALAAHGGLRAVLVHPAVASGRKKAVCRALFEGKVEELSLRLLDLLAERGRLDLLPGIERSYAALFNERRGVVAAEAVTAVPLEDAQGAALEEAIRRATGKGVELAAGVDPSVLGGVLLRMGGRVYDGTVRTRLRALRERLRGGAEGA
jgi:F-type H+-transporting ATPase subunit delta